MIWNTTSAESADKIAAIDFETTGLSPSKDRIVSVGISLYDNGIRQTTYESYINPEGMHVPPGASRVNGIVYEEHLHDAPLWVDVAPEVEKYTAGRLVVAHKLPFDAAFWDQECQRFNLPSPKRSGLCSKVLSGCAGMNGRNSGLSMVAKALRITEVSDNPSYHSGGYDAIVSGQIAVHLIKLLGGYEKARRAHDAICQDVSKLRQLMSNITKQELAIYQNAPD